jgi:hypothetical protein
MKIFLNGRDPQIEAAVKGNAGTTKRKSKQERILIILVR